MEKLEDKKSLLNQIVYCMVEGDMEYEAAIKEAHEDFKAIHNLDSTHFTIGKLDKMYVESEVNKHR